MYITKLKKIFPTFIIITILLTSGLSAINWLLVIDSEVITWKEEVFQLFIPLIIPWIPILIWLNPKIKLLSFSSSRNKFFFQIISWLSMALILMLTQGYLYIAAEKFTTVSQVSEIKLAENIRYYEVKNYTPNQEYSRSYMHYERMGRDGANYHMTLYFVSSFKEDTTVWYGIKYQHTISNELSDEEKNKESTKFYELSLAAFQKYAFSKIGYFERLPNSTDKQRFDKALEIAKAKNKILLVPQEWSYEERVAIEKRMTLVISGLAIGMFLIALYFPKLKEIEKP